MALNCGKAQSAWLYDARGPRNALHVLWLFENSRERSELLIALCVVRVALIHRAGWPNYRIKLQEQYRRIAASHASRGFAAWVRHRFCVTASPFLRKNADFSVTVSAWISLPIDRLIHRFGMVGWVRFSAAVWRYGWGTDTASNPVPEHQTGPARTPLAPL